MTTESGRPPSPRLNWSALEWRLFLTGVLASVWTFVMVMLWTASPAEPSTPAVAEEPAAPDPEPRAAAPAPQWLERIPPEQRPAVTPPPGWVVTTLPSASAPVGTASRAAAPVVSVVKRRPVRIRTRSS